MKLLSYDDLKPTRGITLGKIQLWRLEKVGKFPKRVRVGAQRYAWLESEIDAWLAERASARTPVSEVA